MPFKMGGHLPWRLRLPEPHCGLRFESDPAYQPRALGDAEFATITSGQPDVALYCRAI
jgi:hypothetical protein